MTDRELMEMAIDALEQPSPIGGFDNQAYVAKALRNRLAQPEPEPVAWFPAPVKTEWGENMVMTELAISDNHTVDIYCEADQVKKVEEMLDINKEPKALRDRLAQPEWVGLTDEEVWECYSDRGSVFYRAIEAKLKEKNI